MKQRIAMCMLAIVVGIATVSAQQQADKKQLQHDQQVVRSEKHAKMMQKREAMYVKMAQDLQLDEKQSKQFLDVMKKNDQDRFQVEKRCRARLHKVLTDEQLQKLEQGMKHRHTAHAQSQQERPIRQHQQMQVEQQHVHPQQAGQQSDVIRTPHPHKQHK